MMGLEQGDEAKEAGRGQAIMDHVCPDREFNFFLKKKEFLTRSGLLFIKI